MPGSQGRVQVSVMSSAQDMAAYRAYSHKMGSDGAAKLAPAENKPAAQLPAVKKAVGVFEEHNLDELMGHSAKVISDFIAAHQDELALNDYQAMLDYELAGKKRVTVIAGLQAHLGGE
jgi:hypothetical protein